MASAGLCGLTVVLTRLILPVSILLVVCRRFGFVVRVAIMRLRGLGGLGRLVFVGFLIVGGFFVSLVVFTLRRWAKLSGKLTADLSR